MQSRRTIHQRKRAEPEALVSPRRAGEREDRTGRLPLLARLHGEYIAAVTALHAAEAARENAIRARDLAIKEVEFLREQLRGTQAYLVEKVEISLVAERNERLALLAEVSLLNEELQERMRSEDANEGGSR